MRNIHLFFITHVRLTRFSYYIIYLTQFVDVLLAQFAKYLAPTGAFTAFIICHPAVNCSHAIAFNFYLIVSINYYIVLIITPYVLDQEINC